MFVPTVPDTSIGSRLAWPHDGAKRDPGSRTGAGGSDGRPVGGAGLVRVPVQFGGGAGTLRRPVDPVGRRGARPAGAAAVPRRGTPSAVAGPRSGGASARPRRHGLATGDDGGLAD